MKAFAERYSMHLLVVLSCVLVAGVSGVSDGLFNIDEFIYVSAIDAFASQGSLIVTNGYEEFGSTNLKLWFLVDGPHGLAPQYPIGSAVAGAPFYSLFGGALGVVFLNVLTGVGTVWLTFCLALRLFDDFRVALLGVLLLVVGSFWTEYVYGIWPHSLSVFLALLSLWCGVNAIRGGNRSVVWAIAAGVAVGGGFLVRADAILVLPALGVMALFYCERPWRLVTWGVVGLLPGLLVSVLANHFKFGTWNPLSYGKTGGGGTDPTTHLPVLLLAGAVMAVLLAVRYGKLRLNYSGKQSALTALGVLGVIILVPEARSLALKFVSGSYALLVDAGAVQDKRPGVQLGGDGVLYFWGFVKKGFGQSMPWLGLMAALAILPWRAHRFAYSFILVAVGFWILPYVFLSWHGGLGSNMRYFLPILPLCAIVVARVWVDLADHTSDAWRAALVGFFGGMTLLAVWAWHGRGQLAGAQQILSTYLFGATVACALLTGLSRYRPVSVLAVQALAAAGLAFAMVFGALDFSAGQARRSLMADISESLAVLPRPNLVLAMPEMMAFQIGKDDGLVAMQDNKTGQLDAQLLANAISSGYRTFVPDYLAPALINAVPDFKSGATLYPYPGGNMVELELR